MRPEYVTIDYQRQSDNFHVLVWLPDDNSTYRLAYRLERKLKDNDDPFSLKVLSASGKIEISLRKVETERWNGIGTPLTGNETWVPQKDFENGDFQKTFRPWTLVSKTQQTPDVSHYVFQPCNKDLHFQVPCGHHVQFKMDIEETEIVRSYTPTFQDLNLNAYEEKSPHQNDKNLHFLIKTYPLGALTPKLSSLNIGSEIDFSYPMGNFNQEILKNATFITLLAAGTGFTPMCKVIQMLYHLSQKEKSKKQILLLNFNKTEKDIIWYDSLTRISNNEYFEFKIENVLSQDQNWNGHKGRVSKNLLETVLPKMENTTKKLACICGPIPFTRDCVRILEQDFIYQNNELWKFEG